MVHFWITFGPLFDHLLDPKWYKMESKVTQTPTQTQTHRRMRGRARKIRNNTFKNKDTASKKRASRSMSSQVSKVAILLQNGIDFGIFRSLSPASVLESF